MYIQKGRRPENTFGLNGFSLYACGNLPYWNEVIYVYCDNLFKNFNLLINLL
jgi:hypothetical protein